MRKLIVSEFMTLDGVIEAPGGEPTFPRSGWAFRYNRGPEGDNVKLEEVLEAGALLLGRVTYEGFARAWPSYKDTVGFADKMNNMPKYVISSTLREASWKNSTILRGELQAEVTKLKQQDGGPLLVAGSASLAQALADLGLVDAYRLMVYPVFLGAGRKLFPELKEAASLTLRSATPVGPEGVLWLEYETKR